MKDASELPIFWAFVGFGGRVEFLEKLDGLRGRKVDNASFFHTANPHTVTDNQLYDGLTHEYAGWLAAATAAGILT
ncbi:VWA domain-containing protein [Streptomyces sp. NPDC055089]